MNYMKETILDNYAFNRLNNKDKAWLKQTLAQDPSFQQELDFHADVVRGMIYYSQQKTTNQALKDKISQIDAELEQEGFFSSRLEKALIESIQLKGEQALQKTILNVDQTLAQEGFFDTLKPTQEKKSVSRLFRILVAAASVILVATVGWQWISPKSIAPQEQYLLAFQPYQNVLSKSIQLELSEYGFGGNPKKEPLNQLLEAMNAYDAHAYKKATNLLTIARENGIDKNYQAIAQFYLALSYMGNDQTQQAIPLLVDLSKQKTVYQETTYWYLGLAYLKNEALDNAKEQLIKLTTSKVYGERAKLLVKQL